MLRIRSQHIIESILFVFNRSHYLRVPLLSESTLNVKSDLFLDLKVIYCAFLKVERI